MPKRKEIEQLSLGFRSGQERMVRKRKALWESSTILHILGHFLGLAAMLLNSKQQCNRLLAVTTRSLVPFLCCQPTPWVSCHPQPPKRRLEERLWQQPAGAAPSAADTEEEAGGRLRWAQGSIEGGSFCHLFGENWGPPQKGILD